MGASLLAVAKPIYYYYSPNFHRKIVLLSRFLKSTGKFSDIRMECYRLKENEANQANF